MCPNLMFSIRMGSTSHCFSVELFCNLYVFLLPTGLPPVFLLLHYQNTRNKKWKKLKIKYNFRQEYLAFCFTCISYPNYSFPLKKKCFVQSFVWTGTSAVWMKVGLQAVGTLAPLHNHIPTQNFFFFFFLIKK